MNLEIEAKNLLEDKTCFNCSYKIFTYPFCEKDGNKKKIPEEKTCKDWEENDLFHMFDKPGIND